jgi:hypothetical protein
VVAVVVLQGGYNVTNPLRGMDLLVHEVHNGMGLTLAEVAVPTKALVVCHRYFDFISGSRATSVSTKITL